MQFQQPFDARQVDPSSFAPPPPMGDYHVVITDSEPVETKDKTGGRLVFQLQILDPGAQLNRKIQYGLNLFNASQQACDIARRELSAICHVTKQFNVSDTRQLHNIPFIAILGPQLENPQYTKVFGVKDIDGNAPGKAGTTAYPPAAPIAQVTAAPAWGPPSPTAPAPTAPAPSWGPPAQAAPAWTAPGPTAPTAPAAPVWGGAPAAPAATERPAWAR